MKTKEERLEKFLCDLISKNLNEKLLVYFFNWFNQEKNSLLDTIEGNFFLKTLNDLNENGHPLNKKLDELMDLLNDSLKKLKEKERSYFTPEEPDLNDLDIRILPDSVLLLDFVKKIHLNWDQLLYFPVDRTYRPPKRVKRNLPPEEIIEELIKYIERFIPFYRKTVTGYTDEEISHALKEMQKEKFPAVYQAYLKRMGRNTGFRIKGYSGISLENALEEYSLVISYGEENSKSMRSRLTYIADRGANECGSYCLLMALNNLEERDGPIYFVDEMGFRQDSDEVYSSFQDMLFREAFRHFVLSKKIFFKEFFKIISKNKMLKIKRVVDEVVKANRLSKISLVDPLSPCYESEESAIEIKLEEYEKDSKEERYVLSMKLASNSEEKIIMWDKKVQTLLKCKETDEMNAEIFSHLDNLNMEESFEKNDIQRIKEKYTQLKKLYKNYGSPIWSQLKEFGKNVVRPYHPALLNTQLINNFITSVKIDYHINIPDLYYDLFYKIVLKEKKDQLIELDHLDSKVDSLENWEFLRPYFMMIKELWLFILDEHDITSEERLSWYYPAYITGKNIFRIFESYLGHSMQEIKKNIDKKDKEKKESYDEKNKEDDKPEKRLFDDYDIKDPKNIEILSGKHLFQNIPMNTVPLQKGLDYYFEKIRELKNSDKEKLSKIICMIASREWNWGSIKKAVDWYQQAIKFCKLYQVDHMMIESYTYLASCYADSGEINKAKELFSKIIIDTKNEDLLYAQARLLYYTGRFAQAIEKLKKITGNHSNYYIHTYSYILLGDIFKNRRKYDDAEQMYQKAHDGGMIGKEFCYYRFAAISALKNDKEKALYYLHLLKMHSQSTPKNLVNFLAVKKYNIKQTAEDEDFSSVHHLDEYKKLLK